VDEADRLAGEDEIAVVDGGLDLGPELV